MFSNEFTIYLNYKEWIDNEYIYLGVMDNEYIYLGVNW